MSRIHQSGPISGGFSPSSRVSTFQPEAAVSNEKAAREYGNALIQDAETLGRDLARSLQQKHSEEAIARGISTIQLSIQQQRERGKLSKEQLVAKQAVEMQQTEVQGLLQRHQLERTGNFKLRAQQTQDDLTYRQGVIGGGFDLSQQLASNRFSMNQGIEQLIMKSGHMAQAAQLQGASLSAQTGYNYEGQRLNLAQGVASARTSAIGNAIQGLLRLGGQGFDLYQQANAVDQEAIANQQTLEAIGLGDANFGAPPSPQQVTASSIQNKVVAAESSATGTAAQQLMQTGDPVNVSAGVQLTQGTTFQQLGAIRGNVYAARAMFPAAFEEAVGSGAIRPGAEGYQDSVQFIQRFALAAGLGGADRAAVAKIFAPTALAALQNSLVRVTGEHAEATKAANQISVKSKLSALAAGATVSSIGDDIKLATEEVIHGGIGFHGKHGLTSNAFTVAEFLTTLSEQGKIDEIQALRNVEMVPGTKITWGQQFHHLFEAAEKQAFESNIREYDTHTKLRGIAHDRAVRIYRDNPNPETFNAMKDALRSIGTEEALRELAGYELRGGANYDPTIAARIQQDIGRGSLPTMATLNELVEGGYISWEEHAAFSPQTIDKIEKDDNLEPLFKSLETDIKAGIRDSAQDKDIPSEALAQIGPRARIAVEMVKERFKALAATNPHLLDPARKAEAESVLATMMADVLTQQQFQFENQQGWKAPISGQPAPENAAGSRDFTQVEYDSPGRGKQGPVLGTGEFLYYANLNPAKDRLITNALLESDVAAVAANNMAAVSSRTRSLAGKMNISPKAFLVMQSMAHGRPNPFPLASEAAQPAQKDYKPSSPTTSRRDVTVQIGRQLQAKGFVMWQHPNFDLNRGYVSEGGARVGSRNYDSLHHSGRALDLPLSHNSQDRLDWLYHYLNQNRQRFGIKELLWRFNDPNGHWDHLHVGF
jgi:hypothetical protein